MDADQLVRTVRQQLGLGRVLPLGGPGDGSWITEQAAAAALREAAGALPGIRPGRLRLSLADPDVAPRAAVPPPPSALPPGPLRITADFSAGPDRPVPVTAGLLREALLARAADGLGLVVAAVDLRVTALLEEGEAAGAAGAVRAWGTASGTGEVLDDPPAGRTAGDAGAGPEGGPAADPADEVTRAVLRVPGVSRPAPVLGGSSQAVRREPGHVLVQVAAGAGRRTLDVALAVRQAAADAAPGPVTVAVLITAVDAA
ncbi:hypothetical protein [Streptomyces sp. MST-110588]|uniref:hypothetical protein n=1 Tax=Streptomyces sp. MST-110588 TaxID=2833628 RepID=UPI001F5D2EB5|nr:hypothetical protein [Streptomyces sp. MST-110588]UNO42784.1 hypothetical protein KGS77_28690 [Streptomyces sp. MST-110588]